jgi:hypothetical protein
MVFEFHGWEVGRAGAGIRRGAGLSATALVSTFKIGVEVFETQRDEDAGHEGDSYGCCAVGFGVIAHRHRVIVIGPYCTYLQNFQVVDDEVKFTSRYFVEL